jgi:hypothetical protein
LSKTERLGDRDDPDLLALGADESDLRGADAVVDARFDADVTSRASSVAGFPATLLLCCRRPSDGSLPAH